MPKLRILIVSATRFEIAPLLHWLEENSERSEQGVFVGTSWEVYPLVTGAGIANTALTLGYYLAGNVPNLAINAGIAGAIDQDLCKTAVYHVVSERFGDFGVEDSDGRFLRFDTLGLTDPYTSLYQDQGVLENKGGAEFAFLPAVHGLTVNTVHGNTASIEGLKADYPTAQTESMEGAAFFLACKQFGIPFVQLRAISNFVEPRNRDNWDIGGAIDNLNTVLINLLKTLT